MEQGGGMCSEYTQAHWQTSRGSEDAGKVYTLDDVLKTMCLIFVFPAAGADPVSMLLYATGV